MTIYDDIFSGLSGHAGLAGLVSDRIYPLRWPEEPAFPLVTYQPIGGPWEQSVSRQLAAIGERVQFDCWADDFDTAVDVRRQLRAALLVFPEGLTPLYEVGIAGDDAVTPEPETGLQRAMLEARFVHG